MKYHITIPFYALFIIALSFNISACSNSYIVGAKSDFDGNNVVKHSHQANKCIDAISHAHPNGKKDHLHYFHSCEANNINSNAHSHPSNSITGFTRHVHPNGANEHTHGR